MKNPSAFAHPAALLLVAATFTSTASAALIAYEGFDYTLGSSSLDGLNGGSGWASAWVGDPYGNGTLSAGQSFSSLITSGGAYTTRGGGSDPANQSPYRVLATPVTSGTVWISFLSSATGTTGSRFHGLVLSANIAGETAEAFSIGETWDGGTRATYGSQAGGEPGVDTGVTTSGVGFNALSIDLATGNYTYWVNPTLGGSSPSGGTSVSYTAGNTPLTFNGLALRANEMVVFDEIRIGTTWADVSPSAIPEPSSFALLGSFAAAGAAALRRRRF